MTLHNIIQTLFKYVFRLTEIIAPSLATRWAIYLFTRPMKFKRPEWEERLIKEVERRQTPFRGFYPRPEDMAYYTTYSWGKGPAVLLVHGWAGRGSQMASLAGPLVEAGCRVISFDAPAHGDSPGKETNLIEVSRVIQDIAGQVGDFQAIIGHSFGGMAAGLAMSNGVKAHKLITISSPASMEYILDSFARQINATDKIVVQLKDYIKTVTGKNIEAFSLATWVALLNPSGLILHDKQDRDVSYDQALTLSEQWPNSQLITTEGLGHRRILRNQDIIARIVEFSAAEIGTKIPD